MIVVKVAEDFIKLRVPPWLAGISWNTDQPDNMDFLIDDNEFLFEEDYPSKE